MPTERRAWWLLSSFIVALFLLQWWRLASLVIFAYLVLHGLWTVWRWRRAERQERFDEAIRQRKMEAETALLEEDVRRAAAQRYLISENYIGTQHITPDYSIWTYKREVSPAVVRMEEQASQLTIAAALPHAASVFEALPALAAAAGRILLGYANDGPVWLSVDELLSVAMAGNSGRGKSRALLWLALQLIRGGVTTLFLDGKGDLRRWLAPYHAVAYTPSDIKQSVDAILLEADWRLRMAADDPDATFAPLIVILDELDLVLNRYPKTLDLVELLTKKTRSVNVHGIYSNQSVPADLVGGVATRGVIVSRICFYCDDEAARLIGVRANNGAAALLQQIAPPAPVGLSVARTAAFGWKLLAFPYVDDRAVRYLLDGGEGIDELPPLPKRQDFALSRPEAAMPECTKTPLLSASEIAKREMLDWYRQGFTKPHVIARKMGKASSYADDVRLVLQEEGLI